MNLETYKDLFVHRSDVYAVQQSNGMYFPAGKHRWDAEAKKAIYDEYYPLTDDELAEHLGGQASYGAYVIEPYAEMYEGGERWKVENTVKYVVFDLDTYDEAAWEWLRYCLNDLIETCWLYKHGPNKRCLLAENSGGKGYHVWLFLTEPLPAAQVRRWIARDFLPMWHTKSASFPGSPLEIFPKQDAPPVLGGFGNLVKLPLGVHAVTGNRSTFVVNQGWASGIDTVQKLDASLIPAIEGPQPRKDGTSRALPTGPSNAAGIGGDSGPAPFACISHIIENGAPQGCRDDAMFHFARYACGAGIPPDLVLEWCLRVNEEFDPPLTQREVNTKVRSASAMESPHPGCNADWLRGFCPGGETCFAPWNTERSNRKPVVDDASDYLSLSPEERRLLRGKA